MSYKDMFHEQLIRLEVEGATEEAVFEKVAVQLRDLGFVNEGYLRGITAREQKFPTGLITQHVNIALPHSDPEYVEKPFVYIARLKNEVKVKQMGDSQEMGVKNLFFLGIKDPKGQVGLHGIIYAGRVRHKVYQCARRNRYLSIVYSKHLKVIIKRKLIENWRNRR